MPHEISSAALVVDGYHARTDGFASLAVVLGAVGVWAGLPLADAIVGLLITAIAHRPLSKVPENTLKFGVGVMLSAFGVFWTGEGLGVEWPGHDLALFVFKALFLIAGPMSARMVRQPVKGVRL